MTLPRVSAVLGPSSAAVRARIGVSLLFLSNAVVYASVVPRLPELKQQLSLSNVELGFAIAAAPLGALAAGLIASRVIRRLGSARAAAASSAIMAANLLVIGSAQNLWWLAAGFFFAGFCDSVGDVANNMHGLRVQRRLGRSIINSFHGVWSVGAVLGGALGFLAAGMELPILATLTVTAAVFVVVSLLTLRLLLPGHDDLEREAARAADDTSERQPQATEPSPTTARSPKVPRSVRVHALRLLAAIGAVGALAGVIEDSGASWGAVYLSGTLGTGPGVAGMAFISMAVFMTIGRLSGDLFVNRFGDRAVATVGALIAALGVTAALAFPTVLTTVLGFGLAGLGTATLIPASMHAADHIIGFNHGVALTATSLIMRAGFLLSPPLIGLIADAASLRVGLLVVPLAAVLIVVCARALPGRRTNSSTAAKPRNQSVEASAV